MTDSNRLASVSLRYSERRSLDSGRSNTSALDSYIYILWGNDLAAGAEGAVKYWRLLRGNPNIALLFNLRLFFSSSNTTQFIFFYFFYRHCKETLSASRGIYKKKQTMKTFTTGTAHLQPTLSLLWHDYYSCHRCHSTTNDCKQATANDCQGSSGETGGFFFSFPPFLLRLDFIKVCSQKLWRVVLGIIQRDEIRKDGIQVWGRIREMDTLSVVWLVCISSVAIFIRNLPIIVCDCGL